MDISDAIESFQQFLLAEKGLSKQTVISYTQDLKQFFKYFYTKTKVEDLSENDLAEFLMFEMSSESISVTTAIRRLSSTRQFYLFLKSGLQFAAALPYQANTTRTSKQTDWCLFRT